MSDVTMTLGELVDCNSSFQKLSATNLKNVVLSYKVAMLKKKIKEHVEAYYETIQTVFKDAGAVDEQMSLPDGGVLGMLVFPKDDDGKEVVSKKKQKACNDQKKELREKEITIEGVPQVTTDMLKNEAHPLTPDDFLALEWLIELKE
jgi:hypothetical protein